MNKTLENAGKEILKSLLSRCTSPQKDMFKRMYGKGESDIAIDECVDNMDADKIDWAITQCEKTLENNRRGFDVAT